MKDCMKEEQKQEGFDLVRPKINEIDQRKKERKEGRKKERKEEDKGIMKCRMNK